MSVLLEEVDSVVISKDMNKYLLKVVSDSKVKEAIFYLGALKVLGPNDFSGIFLLKVLGYYWPSSLQGPKEFFHARGFLLKKLNNTNIILIPKCPALKSINHFHLISICNFSYKIISKIITNRLKHFFNHIISQNQVTFVPNRLVHDIIFIVQAVSSS